MTSPSAARHPPSPHQVGEAARVSPRPAEGRLRRAPPPPAPGPREPAGVGETGLEPCLRQRPGTLPSPPSACPPPAPSLPSPRKPRMGGKALKGTRTCTGAGALGGGRAWVQGVPRDSCTRVTGLAAGLPRACTADGHMWTREVAGVEARPARGPPGRTPPPCRARAQQGGRCGSSGHRPGPR